MTTVAPPNTQFVDNVATPGAPVLRAIRFRQWSAATRSPVRKGQDRRARTVRGLTTEPAQQRAGFGFDVLFSHCGDVNDNSADEDSFIVRRDGVNLRTIGPNLLSFNDSTATPGLHTYTVAAMNESENAAFPTTNNGYKRPVPAIVTGVNATDNLSDRVTVTWTNIAFETGYNILRDGGQIGTVGVDVTTYDDLTATPNVTYTYTVQAFNKCGNGTVCQGIAVFAWSRLRRRQMLRRRIRFVPLCA